MTPTEKVLREALEDAEFCMSAFARRLGHKPEDVAALTRARALLAAAPAERGRPRVPWEVTPADVWTVLGNLADAFEGSALIQGMDPEERAALETCFCVARGAVPLAWMRPAPASPEPRPVRLGPSFDPAEVADYHYGMGQECAMRDAVAWLHQHPGYRAAALDLAREFKVAPPAASPEPRPESRQGGAEDIEALRRARRAASPEPEGERDRRVFWSVSSDEERFTGDFDTREEAIAAAPAELGLHPGDSFWIGRGSHYEVPHVDVDGLFERMAEQAGEDCGEVAEDWGPVPDEECEREVLAAVLRCLARQKETPEFWTVDDIEKHAAPTSPPSPAPEAEPCPKCGGPTEFVTTHRDGSGRRFFVCSDQSCQGGVWRAPSPAAPLELQSDPD